MHGKSLAQMIEEMVMNSEITEEQLDILLAGIQRLRGSGSLEAALQLGAAAPEFELADQHGRPHSLLAHLERGPVLLQFIRGDWCPFCQTQLRALNAQREAIAASGATLLIVSPETAEKHIAMALREGLELTLLSDPGGRVSHEWGIAYDLGSAELQLYRDLGIEPTESDLSGKRFLPVPASYIIGRDGLIHFAYIEPDFRNRLEPADMLAALQRLAGSSQS